MISPKQVDSTFQHPYRPLPIRLLNQIGNGLRKCGLSPANLSKRSLLKTASSKTGLKNFGDSRFEAALEIILEAIEQEAELNFFGRVMAREMLVSALSNRLRIIATLEKQPEILNTEINRPLFIVGFPRTGTTLLHNILSQDQFSRAPQLWEMIKPTTSVALDAAARKANIKLAKNMVKTVGYLAPQMSAIQGAVHFSG